jgi:adenylyl-sulfate kinase
MSPGKTNNLTEYQFGISKDLRSKRLKQNPKLLWFTGLSGSGKSTIANEIEKKLFSDGFMTYTLDGDNIRNGLCNNLTFSKEDRSENIRRIAELSKLFLDAGFVVCASFVSPFSKDRNMVKDIVGPDNYLEIYINTPLEVCEQRDVKGLYAKARAGKIIDFTGISSPFEPPELPYMLLDTTSISIEKATTKVYNEIIKKIK